MAQRVGRSFADLITALQQLQAGLKEGAGADSKQKEYLDKVTGALGELTTLDDQQEKAKAALHSTSQKLSGSEAQARDLAAKVIAYLESQLGKTSPALQRYGVAPRIPGRKTTPQAKAPTEK